MRANSFAGPDIVHGQVPGSFDRGPIISRPIQAPMQVVLLGSASLGTGPVRVELLETIRVGSQVIDREVPYVLFVQLVSVPGLVVR
jgi:hypothetical protein